MKALAVRQPWAWALIAGIKPVENRDWKDGNPALHFARAYRGPVLIHASASMSRGELSGFHGFTDSLTPKPPMVSALDLKFGGIIGVADLVGIVTSHASPWFFGPVGLVFDNARPLPFIPFKGALGFFDVPDHLIARVV